MGKEGDIRNSFIKADAQMLTHLLVHTLATLGVIHPQSKDLPTHLSLNSPII